MRVDQETASLALYQLEACPFCVKVRRAMKRLNLRIELRDIKRSEKFAAELKQNGGQDQVPCLRIPGAAGKDQWMYESDAIIEYLKKTLCPQRGLNEDSRFLHTVYRRN
jgi:glutathione S-transferase